MVLRDGAVLDGKLYLSEGQTLALYLGSRKGGWVNVVDVVWAADSESSPHLVLQVDHLALAASIDHDIPAVVGAATAAVRWVHIGLENGTKLQGCLFLAERQRLSDYLHAVGKFLPITRTQRLADQAALGDVAINCASIKMVRDIEVPVGSESAEPDLPDPTYGVFIVDETPVTRQSIRTDVATLTLLTPGRLPDRRASEQRPRISTSTPAALEADIAPLTREQELGVQKAARHWLGVMAAKRGMAPPVGRLLSATPSVAEIWRALCSANDMAEEELAAVVAAECKAPIAAFESVDAKAVAQIPGKIARRLNALPVSVQGNALHVATADPLDPSLEQQLRFVTKMRVEVEIAPPTVIEHALDWWYPEGGTGAAFG